MAKMEKQDQIIAELMKKIHKHFQILQKTIFHLLRVKIFNLFKILAKNLSKTTN